MRRMALGLAVAAMGCVQQRPLQTSGPIDLVFAATTDLHGYVRGWDYYANRQDSVRGLSRVATIIDSLRRASSTYPVVVDAGDIIQGNPLAFVAARVDTTIRHP